jgi:hypothetical protein
LKFGTIVLTVGEGRMVGISNLANKAPPAPLQLSAVPHEPFFILLSREAMQMACQSGTADLVGKTAGKDGSESFGIGKASYHGSVRLDAVSIQVSADPTVVTASVAVSASANAGISVLDTIIGGIKTGANAVAGVATTAGNAIASGTTTAAHAVASGVTTAANAVAHAFHSY